MPERKSLGGLPQLSDKECVHLEVAEHICQDALSSDPMRLD